MENAQVLNPNDKKFKEIALGVNAILGEVSPTKGKAWLFGSRARGDAHADSDWDLLVLLDKDRITAADMDGISYPIRELGWELGEMVNPIMFTTKEWQKKSATPFYKNVMEDGIALH